VISQRAECDGKLIVRQWTAEVMEDGALCNIVKGCGINRFLVVEDRREMRLKD